MIIHTPDNEKKNLSIAHQKTTKLLWRSAEKHVCPCCTARVLAFHAEAMAATTMGSAAAIEMFEEIIIHLREKNIPAPDYGSSSETH
jgi:cellobiose-specific phosphotransferase system component IIA